MTDFEMYPMAMTLLAGIPLLLSFVVVTVTVAGVLPASTAAEEGNES